MGQGAYRQRGAKVSKFPTALDKNTGEIIPLKDLRDKFFAAANSASPKAALRTLRETFHLACPHCQSADLVFSFGSQNPDGTINAIAGSNIAGNPAHLKTKAGETHGKNCIGVVIPQESHAIDAQKGFRIHLNLKNIPERHPSTNQLITRDSGGKIVILDPDLKDREPWEFSKPEKILPLMKSRQIERLNKSVVIYGGRKIPWGEFFIPSINAETENPNLTRFALSFFADGATGKAFGHPLMIDFSFAKASYSNHHDEKGRARYYSFPKSAEIYIPALGGNIKIQPQLRVENQHLFDQMDHLHRTHGKILLVAERPFIYKRDDKTNNYILAMTLTDPDMMVVSNPTNIMAIAAKKRASSSSAQSQPAQPHP